MNAGIRGFEGGGACQQIADFGTLWDRPGEVFETESADAIRRARELGVNLFDTAQAYGFGASERILGGALADELTRDRDEIVIATKGGLHQTDSGLVRDASPEWLRRGVNASLTALGIDHIDLYQVHWPDMTAGGGVVDHRVYARRRPSADRDPTAAGRHADTSGLPVGAGRARLDRDCQCHPGWCPQTASGAA